MKAIISLNSGSSSIKFALFTLDGANNPALSAGGKQVRPFAETFWSPGYGAVVDQFGIPWMVNTIPGADWKPAAAG